MFIMASSFKIFSIGVDCCEGYSNTIQKRIDKENVLTEEREGDADGMEYSAVIICNLGV